MFGFGKSKGSATQPAGEPQEAAEQSQLFMELVMGQAQNILFVLGQIPTPDGRRAAPDLETGRIMIEQLAMLQIKTEGNLTQDESDMLNKAVAQTRSLFIELAGRMGELEAANRMRERSEQSPILSVPKIEQSPAPKPQPAPEPPAAQPTASTPSSSAKKNEETDPNKRFVKNYGAF